MKTFSTAIATLILGAVSTVPLAAQVSVTVGEVRDPSGVGQTVTLDSAGLGQRVTKRLYLQFNSGGASSISLERVAVQGSNEFSVDLGGDRLPTTLSNRFRYEVLVHYQPSSPGPVYGALQLTVDRGDDSSDSQTSVSSINLVGRVPVYSISYSLPGGAARPVPLGGLVDFGRKPTGVDTQATLVLANVGSLAGTIENASITGGPFRMIEGPSFPFRLDPGQERVIQIAFAPSQTLVYRGQLTFDWGAPLKRVDLTGIGGDLLRYRLVSYLSGSASGAPANVQSGAPIVFGRNAATFEVIGSNTRQSAQRIESVRVTGPFSITTSPNLPVDLAPGQELVVQIGLTPAARGTDTGVLTIGDAIFPVSINVPTLPAVRFSRLSGAVPEAQDVPFGLSLARAYPVDVTGKLSLSFSPVARMNEAGVAWSTGGREVEFAIPAGSLAAVFPGGGTSVDFQTGRIGGEISLQASFAADPWGIDITPPSGLELRFPVEIEPLPEVSFSRVGGTVGVGQEVSLGVSLAAPYSVDLAGTLALRFAPAESQGASGVAWVEGGREVLFTIPAGRTAAMFPGAADAAAFRTGRIAGEILVQARFATDPARVDVTPSSVPEARFKVEVATLPEVRFSRASGTVSAADQLSLGVSLAESYAADIAGVLELRFETRSFVSDPAVQWSTGGRQAAFQIPAGSTEAVFLGEVAANEFQTGTVAGEIVATARFFAVPDLSGMTSFAQIQAVAAEVTPDSVPEVRFSVMEAAPVLRRMELGTTGQGRFTLQITGYSTNRSVDTMSFAFQGTSGSLLRTPDLEADVSETFATYFGGNQSASFGSQFTATVQFTLDEGVFEDLASVTATAASDVGASNSVSLALN